MACKGLDAADHTALQHIAGMVKCERSTPDEWHDLVKGMLRAEMTRRGITYDQLSAKLAEIGVSEQPESLRNKVRQVFLRRFLCSMSSRYRM